MKVKDLMTKQVIRIRPEESVAVAARTLAHYNIGMLPVCDAVGKLCGVVTDRDIVVRCLAAERPLADTAVGDIMTGSVHCVQPEMDATVAAHLMGRQQVRRLPVVDNGALCGMVSLGDLAQNSESSFDATDALGQITENISRR